MRYFKLLSLSVLLTTTLFTQAKEKPDDPLCSEVRKIVKEGDLVFLEIKSAVFQRVARVSGGWASHVGVVVWDDKLGQMVVAHSTIPQVVKWNLCKFIHHGKDSHFAITRLNGGVSAKEMNVMKAHMESQMGKLYHTGFKFYSERQFCSKLAWEMYSKGTGLEIGDLVAFKELLANLEGTEYEHRDMAFWRTWFLGNIPWERVTVTPVSEYLDPRFKEIFYNPPMGDPKLARRVTEPDETVKTKAPSKKSLEVDQSELGG